MRTYFFGDLHGNPDALDACLKHLQEEKADEAYCLGDLAGWLPFGDRTLERIRSTGIPTVAGNHDLLVAGAITDRPHQIDRMQATAYNAGLLSSMEGAIDYLLSLPLIIEKDDFTVVHHSPFDLPGSDFPLGIHCFDYLDDEALERAVPRWRKHPVRLIFSGHDHVPSIFELTKQAELKIHRPGTVESLILPLTNGSRYWVKAGSVGGPYRDGVPIANSALYDSADGTITLYRIPYDTSRLKKSLSSHTFFRNLPTLKKYIDLL